MKKIKKLVVGNWKMNPQTAIEAKKIGSDVKRVMKAIKKTQVVLCAPYIYLSSLSGVTSTTLFLGSQDAHNESKGSFTGEVSFSQLSQFKVSHVIIGHSERRQKGETEEIINKKVLSVVNEGMTAILCIGEKVRDAHGDYLSYIRSQIFAALKDVSKKSLDHLIIAYEPVWAIGGDTAMTSRDIHEMSIYIKKVLREIFGIPADSVRILYGGAVNTENISDIIRNSFVSGVLVGRDSLDTKKFIQIIKEVDIT